MTGDMRNRVWDKENLDGTEGSVERSKKMFVVAFGKHCSSSLYKEKFHLFDHTVVDI